MTCDPFRNQISPWLDGELLSPDDADALQRHLADCAECRSYADDLRQLNSSLDHLSAEHRQKADAVAERVIVELSPAAPPPSSRRTSRLWIVPLAGLLGAAAGFLLAWMIFAPRGGAQSSLAQMPLQNNPGPKPSAVAGRAPESAATLVNVIGDVRVSSLADTTPKQTRAITSFACPTNSVVETGEDSQCELVTTTGCVVRLDCGTKLVVRSPHEVEIYKGQLYCAAPDGKELNVIAAEGTPARKTGTPKEPLLLADALLQCKPNASLWTVAGPEGVKVTSAAGEVDLQTKTAKTTLRSGESCEIVAGAIQPVSAAHDPLLATRWINPLLMQKGPENAELKQRVDAMLARVGLTKLSGLYEAEIRSLGEYSVLPLIRFLESPLSEKNAGQRHTAARIVSDLAPTWAIGDLIKLLEHTDGQVRRQAAAALLRLTDQTQGRTPEDWQASPDTEAVQRWQAWWKTNRVHFPSLEDLQKRSRQEPESKL